MVLQNLWRNELAAHSFPREERDLCRSPWFRDLLCWEAALEPPRFYGCTNNVMRSESHASYGFVDLALECTLWDAMKAQAFQGSLSPQTAEF